MDREGTLGRVVTDGELREAWMREPASGGAGDAGRHFPGSADSSSLVSSAETRSRGLAGTAGGQRSSPAALPTVLVWPPRQSG